MALDTTAACRGRINGSNCASEDRSDMLQDTPNSSAQRADTATLHTTCATLPPDALNDVHMSFTETASQMNPPRRETVDSSALSSLRTMPPPAKGATLKDIAAFVKYQLDRIGPETEILDGLLLSGAGRTERLEGGQAVVQMAQGKWNHIKYAVKFFLTRRAFELEAALYQDKGTPLGKFLPELRAISDNADGAVVDPSGHPLPPCIVMERGESLDIWSERAKPDRMQSFSMLMHLAERLQSLHAAGYVHRDLKPGNVMWLPRENRWTIIDFGCAERVGATAQISFTPLYAAPEVVQAYRAKWLTMEVHEALDAWSLGVMAYELLAGRHALKQRTDREKVMDQITGAQGMLLPWEVEAQAPSVREKLGIFVNPILQLLHRDPAKRARMHDFLAKCRHVLSASAALPAPLSASELATALLSLGQCSKCRRTFSTQRYPAPLDLHFPPFAPPSSPGPVPPVATPPADPGPQPVPDRERVPVSPVATLPHRTDRGGEISVPRNRSGERSIYCPPAELDPVGCDHGPSQSPPTPPSALGLCHDPYAAPVYTQPPPTAAPTPLHQPRSTPQPIPQRPPTGYPGYRPPPGSTHSPGNRRSVDSAHPGPMPFREAYTSSSPDGAPPPRSRDLARISPPGRDLSRISPPAHIMRSEPDARGAAAAATPRELPQASLRETEREAEGLWGVGHPPPGPPGHPPSAYTSEEGFLSFGGWAEVAPCSTSSQWEPLQVMTPTGFPEERSAVERSISNGSRNRTHLATCAQLSASHDLPLARSLSNTPHSGSYMHTHTQREGSMVRQGSAAAFASPHSFAAQEDSASRRETPNMFSPASPQRIPQISSNFGTLPQPQYWAPWDTGASAGAPSLPPVESPQGAASHALRMGSSEILSESSMERCWRTVQVSSDIDGLVALCKALCGNLSGAYVSLKGRTVALRRKAWFQRSSSSDGPSATSWRDVKLWPSQDALCAASVTRGLYYLDKSPVKAPQVCLLTGAATRLTNGQLHLSSGACLVMDSSCADWVFSRVSFKDGTVVCHGVGCRVTFSNCAFKRCTLVATAGACIAASGCIFSNITSKCDGLAILCSGQGTAVTVQGGSITGGVQGVSVQGGASLEAQGLTTAGVSVTGVEVRDEGSRLQLDNCKLEEFSSRPADTIQVAAVLVQARGSAQLNRTNVHGAHVGMHITDGATAAAFRCQVEEARLSCCEVRGGATARLSECKLAMSQKSHGLSVVGAGSHADASNCRMLRNCQSGVFASESATAAVSCCTTEANKFSACTAAKRAEVHATNCESSGDARGFVASGGVLRAHACVVRRCEEEGCAVWDKSKAVLVDCKIMQCGAQGVRANKQGAQVEMSGCLVSGTQKTCVWLDDANGKLAGCTIEGSKLKHGVAVEGQAAQLDAEECLFQKHAQNGVFAADGAQVRLRACRSEQNNIQCFLAQTHARIHLGCKWDKECSWDMKQTGCVGCEGGEVIVERAQSTHDL